MGQLLMVLIQEDLKFADEITKREVSPNKYFKIF